MGSDSDDFDSEFYDNDEDMLCSGWPPDEEYWNPDEEQDDDDPLGKPSGCVEIPLKTFIVTLLSKKNKLVKCFTMWAESKYRADTILRKFFIEQGLDTELAMHDIQFAELATVVHGVVEITDLFPPQTSTFDPRNN